MTIAPLLVTDSPSIQVVSAITLFTRTDLNIFLQWSYGNDILNANRMAFENPQSKKNTICSLLIQTAESENPAGQHATCKSYRCSNSSLYIEARSFLKLKTIPTATLHLIHCVLFRYQCSQTLFVSAENIATITVIPVPILRFYT